MKSLVVNATNRCNLACAHCLRTRDDQCLDPDLFRDVVKQARDLGYERIGFTGGEFCLHPQYHELVRAAVDAGMVFTVVTNGVLAGRYLDLLDEHGPAFIRVTVSIDGPDAGVHDAIRGAGTFAKAVAAVKAFKARGGPDVHVNFCLTRRNVAEVAAMAGLAREIGVDRMNFLAAIPWDGDDEVCLSDLEKTQALEALDEAWEALGHEPRVQVNTSLYGPHKARFCPSLDLESLEVNPRGELVLCCDLVGETGILGSLQERGLRELEAEARGVAEELVAYRRDLLARGVAFEGMDTCVFCNGVLAGD